MSRILNPEQPRTRNLPFAIIVAAGLAAGLGLARPATSNQAQAGTGAATAAATEQEADADGAYRRGNRTAGRRGDTAGQPAPAPEAAPAEGVGGDAGSGSEATAEIVIEGFTYDGATTVAAGSAVTVTNRDGVAHTLSFRSGEADTGTIDGGASATLQAPTAPGTYAYFCRIHPAMAGEIEVTG